MAEAVRLKQLPDEQAKVLERRTKRGEARAKREAMKAQRATFDGKTFSELTGAEKDELLKALAIASGILSE